MSGVIKRLYNFIKVNFSLFLCFISVTTFLFMMISNYLSTKELNTIARGFLTVNFQEFNVSGDINALEFEKVIKENLPRNGAVFRKDFAQEEIIGIYNKKWFKSPPLIKGRFLNEEESFGNKKLAVIGQGLQHRVEAKDNKEWIKINGDSYEVTGVIGAEYESRLDSMIFIPLRLVNEIYSINGNIIVDGIKNSEIFIDKIKSETGGKVEFNKIEGAEIMSGTLDPLTGKSTEEVINSNDLDKNSMTSYIYLIMFISAMLCVISISIYWYEKMKKEIIVCNMLGFYKNEIVFRCIKKYMAIAIMGSIVGSLISIAILSII